MPQSPHSIPLGKGGKPHGKKVSIHQPNKKWLNRTLLGSPVFKIYEQNFAFQKFFFSKVTVNHADFMHFAHSPREFHEIRYKIHPH